MVNVENNKTTTSPQTTPEKSVNTYKLNLSLNPEAKNELESLKIKTHKSSLVDVIRAALVVYKLVIEHQLAGGRVVLRDASNEEETLRII